MLSKEMEDALNRQLNEELYSWYLYLSMVGYFESQGLQGFAKWMLSQSKEELNHAMRIFDYLVKQNSEIKLFSIKEPPHAWDSIQSAVESAFEHEKYITIKIWELVDLARKIDDKATENFLQWYVEEQVREEKNASDLVTKAKMVKGHIGALLSIDMELAQIKD